MERPRLDRMRDPVDYPGLERHTPDEFAPYGQTPLHPDPAPLVRADALVYVVYERPDLDQQTAYLEDFGMRVAARDEDGVYLRGTGQEPYLYVARPGRRARFLGMGFSVRTRAELDALAKECGVPVEEVGDVGGGARVQLVDPAGFLVDVVCRDAVAPLDTRQTVPEANTPWHKARRNRGLRPALTPCPVHRLGHCAMTSENFKRSAQWYMHHLGLLPSDVLCADDGTPVGAFLRLDRGEALADHHSLFLAQGIENKVLHSAFETVDLDALGQGDQFLRSRGHRHAWGIGRHILGSQLFCYHRDPYGDEIEHYADGDVYDNSVPTQYRNLEPGNIYHWGPDLPKDTLPGLGPAELWTLLRGVVTRRLDLETLGKMRSALKAKPRPWA